MASASPRVSSTSSCFRSRPGMGRRASLPWRPCALGVKATWISGSRAMARKVAAVARLKRSMGISPLLLLSAKGGRSLFSLRLPDQARFALTPVSGSSLPKQR